MSLARTGEVSIAREFGRWEFGGLAGWQGRRAQVSWGPEVVLMLQQPRAGQVDHSSTVAVLGTVVVAVVVCCM